jgi:release factor glutamine methyltransferase
MIQRVRIRCAAIDGDWAAPHRYPVIIADAAYLTPEGAARYPDDPPLAVLGGADGLDVVRTCLLAINRRLDPDGAAVVQLRGAPR